MRYETPAKQNCNRFSCKISNEPAPPVLGELALHYLTGSLLNDIFNRTTSILVSLLHFGQKSGKLRRTESAYTFARVFPPQIGHGIQCPLFCSMSIVPHFPMVTQRQCVWLYHSSKRDAQCNSLCSLRLMKPLLHGIRFSLAIEVTIIDVRKDRSQFLPSIHRGCVLSDRHNWPYLRHA